MSHASPLRLAGPLLLFAQVLACSGETEVSAQPSMADVVSRLESENLEVRSAAVEDLDEMAEAGLRSADAMLALQAATRSFPPLEREWQNASAELVRAARTSRNPALVDLVRDGFSRYPPPAKEQALALLSSIDSVESTDLFVKLTLDEARNPTGVTSLLTDGFAEAPRHADRLFPALLGAMESAELRWGVAYLALKYFEEAELARGALDAHYGAIDAPLRDLLRNAKRLERPDDDWLWTDEYQEIRGLAGLLLDLSGYFDTEESSRNIAAGLESADRRLQFFSARGLMSVGRDVSDEVLRGIAASSEMRNHLFEYLQSTNRVRSFPREFLSQEAFAESEMVDWLIYPTELARAPSEIELVRTVDAALGGEDYTYYVFKFRTHPPHWAADDGWMLGVAGPFLDAEAPSPTAYGDTFSTFAKLDETDVDEYVDEIRALLQESRARQGD